MITGMITGNYFYYKLLLKSALGIAFFLLLASFLSKAHAATLINASNTITTSRPSASTPLSANGGSGDTLLSVFNNGSFFLASDSAKIINGATGALVDASNIVASQSSNLTTVYFGETIGTASFAGVNVLLTPITAMHHLKFTVPTTIPNTGDILITFPSLTTGDANNEASASASTFQFNNMDANDGTLIKVVDDGTDITANTTITASNPAGGGSSPTILITIDTGTVAAGSVVDVFIGCSAVTGASCTTQIPTLINPTKSQTAGIADVWKINIQTRNATDVNLDNATVAVGTIESVTVRATVDPTLSFTITGIANGSAVNTGNATGCSQTELTNAGIASTATEVNLGLLADTPAPNSPIGNVSAQRINISTNAAGGYVLTATSSGSLINPATGFFLESSTVPASFPSNGSDWFGLHACGLDVSAATWVEGGSGTSCVTEPATSTGTECLYGWPTRTSAITLASDSAGPIGNSVAAGNGIVSVSYAASTDALIPPGEYRTVVTYVATPTF